MPTLGANEAQVVGVCWSNPFPRSQAGMGTEREVGGGLARRLALLCQSNPGTAAEAGPAPSAPTDVAVNAINMFVARPAPLKRGERDHGTVRPRSPLICTVFK